MSEANRRIDSEAFYTPELDAAIAASLCPPGGVVATLPPGWKTSAECEAEAQLVFGERRARLLKRADWIRRVCAEAEAKLAPHDARLGLDFGPGGRNR